MESLPEGPEGPDVEITEDLLSMVTMFAGRLYGARGGPQRGKRPREEGSEDQPNLEADIDSQSSCENV